MRKRSNVPATAFTVFLIAVCGAIAYLMLSDPEIPTPEASPAARKTEAPAPDVPEPASVGPESSEAASVLEEPPDADSGVSLSGTVLNEMTGGAARRFRGGPVGRPGANPDVPVQGDAGTGSCAGHAGERHGLAVISRHARCLSV